MNRSRLRHIKDLFNGTWNEFAEFCGVPRQTIQDITYNHKEPKIGTLITIANALKISLDYLVGRRDNQCETERLQKKIERFHQKHLK